MAEYEVQPNPHKIEKLIFRKDSGWFACGDMARLY